MNKLRQPREQARGLRLGLSGVQGPAGRWALAFALIAVFCFCAHFVLHGATWESGSILHTLSEVTGTALAAFVAILAFVRYVSQRCNPLLFISTGFAGAAVLQGYHTLLTSFQAFLPSALSLPTAIPWSWLTERVFLGLMLFLGYLSAEREARSRRSSGPVESCPESLVYVAAAVLTVFGVALVALAPLPSPLFSSLFFPRLFELIPAALFVLAFIGYWRLGAWKQDSFDRWLMLSLLTAALGQAAFMVFSVRIYDPLFVAAHIAKAVSYGAALTGFLASIRSLYCEAQRNAEEATEASLQLRRRVAERDEALEALRLEKLRLQALARLNEMTEAPLHQITEFSLEEAVRLTGSTIGYLAFTSENETVLTMHAWSKSAMKECVIIDKPIVYQVAATGLWGEAIRQRKPVITNDYQAPNPLKKGYPEGHVQVARHMNIPVFDGERIVAVAGVGNKAEDYDDTDILHLGLLMTGMWRLIHRRNTLEELRGLNETLETKVEERTALAERRSRQLERSNAELEQFAYAASHDLQEPLRMVASYTQLLARRYQGKLDQDADDFIRFAVEGATRMKALINDLLDFSRVGRLERPLEPTECGTVFESVLEDLDLSIRETGAVVTTGAMPQVLADRVQLGRLFQNLLANAIKFRGDQPPRIHVEVEPLEGQWHFSVADNGIGIPPECLGRVFHVFQRFHERARYPGNGIGLATCKKIVSRHGGRIWVDSQLAQGTTFHFTIPTLEQAAHGNPTS